MNKVTYICLFNNLYQLNSLLLPSMEILREHNLPFNLILVDSKREGYKSAAQAYNKTINKLFVELSEIVCFLHQDIRFDSPDFHKRLIDEFQVNSRQILGVAGIRRNERTRSNLRYWNNKDYITSTHIEEKSLLEVESLDECCFATTKEVLYKCQFDENCCNNWHLYAVDFCYAARFYHDVHSFVVGETVYHKFNEVGGLEIDFNYLRSLRLLLHKYASFTKWITTPCYFDIRTGYCGYPRLFKTYCRLCLGRIKSIIITKKRS